tara:strand:+ start:1771 stop:2007 length:237 start_codon:yes stop_codon:yes gene_type:complete
MQYVKRVILALALSLMPLNGCAKDASDGLCLTVADYSPEEQAAVADELTALGSQSKTGRLMADYGRLRDEARALCAQN